MKGPLLHREGHRQNKTVVVRMGSGQRLSAWIKIGCSLVNQAHPLQRRQMTIYINQIYLLWMVALVYFGAVSASCQQDDTKNINQIWASGLAAFQEGKIKDARDNIAEFIELVPFEPSSRILMARCQAKLGDTDGASASLSKACELGWEDAAAVKDHEELAVLRDMPTTAKVFANMEENRKRQFVLYTGKTVDRTKASPLIVLYHGRGELPAVQMHFWKQAADRGGWMILALKGTRKIGSVYAWERHRAQHTCDVDTDKIYAKTRNQIAEVTQSNKISEVVLAGFSQGGVAAYAMLGKALTPRPAGAVLFATAFPEKLDEQIFQRPKGFNGRIIAHVGENDRWAKGNRAVVEVLKQSGVAAEIHMYEGISHQMPPNHTQIILQAVNAILNSKSETNSSKSG